jgi:hypothetical protein
MFHLLSIVADFLHNQYSRFPPGGQVAGWEFKKTPEVSCMILETSGCICRHDTLEELEKVTGKSLLSMAVFVGRRG